MKKLEKIVNCYIEQKKTLASHLVAFGLSTATAALATKLASDASGDSTAISSIVGTISAMGVYWPTFIGGLILRDRKDFRGEKGINWGSVKDRSMEYASWFGIGEVFYGTARTGIHAYLQEEGYEPETASVIADTVTAGTYTLGLPFIQIGIDYVKSKLVRGKKEN